MTEETTTSVEQSPEDLLAEVRSYPNFAVFEATAGQMPVVITEYRGDQEDLSPTLTATPVDPVDGGDGSHTTVQSKIDDYVWKPFVAPDSFPMEEDFNDDGTIWFDTPYNQTESTANDTAVIAANALTKY